MFFTLYRLVIVDLPGFENLILFRLWELDLTHLFYYSIVKSRSYLKFLLDEFLNVQCRLFWIKDFLIH